MTTDEQDRSELLCPESRPTLDNRHSGADDGLSIPSETEMILRLINWGSEHALVRAMLISSTRAVPGAHIDLLSDYDVILVVSDLSRFVRDHSWLEDFGEPLVVYWDAIRPDPDYGIETSGNVTQYVSGLKIDFSLWPAALLCAIAAAPDMPAELDAGYRVLLDKDGLTDDLPPPTHTAYIPQEPSRTDYETHVNDFLTDAPYVAKCLWRGDLFPAKWCLDYDMKLVYLLRMLEWRVEIDHDWSLPVGYLGKGLLRNLPADLWSQIEWTFAGGGIAHNWQALDRTLTLFRQVGREVGARLGFDYPEALHQRVVEHVARIRALPPPAAPDVSGMVS